jgi:N-acetylglutamate synthase-like GNAT family acetyltransferase
MRVRPSEARDQAALDRLAAQLHTAHGVRPVKPVRTGARCIVAEEMDQVIGFAIVTFIDYGLESSGYLEELIVDGQFRGAGAGKRLLESCLAWLRENGIDVLFVPTNNDAEPFYLSLGFRRCTGPWLARRVTPQDAT